MNRNSLFAIITILLLALVLAGCGPAFDETQTAAPVLSLLINNLTNTAPPAVEETAAIVTHSPFDEETFMNSIKVVVFDCDGVLFDTEKGMATPTINIK